MRVELGLGMPPTSRCVSVDDNLVVSASHKRNVPPLLWDGICSVDTIGQLLVTTLERHVCGAYVAALAES